jgi:hypothetical protein
VRVFALSITTPIVPDVLHQQRQRDTYHRWISTRRGKERRHLRPQFTVRPLSLDDYRGLSEEIVLRLGERGSSKAVALMVTALEPPGISGWFSVSSRPA